MDLSIYLKTMNVALEHSSFEIGTGHIQDA